VPLSPIPEYASTPTTPYATRKVVDYSESPNPKRKESRQGRLLKPNGGAIALQAHDPDSTWYFKEIRIKRLKD
jgi:hypothetical protein